VQITRELKTGVIAVASLALFIWGFNYLGGKNLLKPKLTTFFSEFQNVQGLNTASPVTINGFQVGKVQEILFNKDPEKRGSFIVEFSMEADFDFAKNSVAKIYSDGLMGGKALAVIPSYEGEAAKSGDYLKGEVESDFLSSFSDKLNPLQAKVESMIVQADSLLVGLNDILDTKTRTRLKSSVTLLNASMTNLKSLSDDLDTVLKENKGTITSTLENAKNTTEKFSALTENLNAELEEAEIAKTVQELKSTLDNINKLVSGLEQGEGSVGKLLKDENLYENLENASKELEELLRDMKENPKRYVHFSVFGKKNKGYEESTE
jgi:phospholipid/cholesterol/gamma-HCH transport system substrate-binding protein